MPQPMMRCVDSSHSVLVIPSSRPSDRARPLAAHGKAAFPYLIPCAFASVSVIPTQLFSYHVADHRGTDVDQPRNLAKSVTVE